MRDPQSVPRSVQLFASPSEEPRARRPTDVIVLIVSVAGLVAGVAFASGTGGVERAVADLAAALPQWLTSTWQFLYDVMILWAIGLVVLALVARRRWALVRDMFVAGIIAIVVGLVLGRIVDGSWTAVGAALDGTGPLEFPAVRLALACAVISTASVHLGRPLRRAGRWIVGIGTVATVGIGVTAFGGAVAALLTGLAAASATHLLFGSPGGRPTLSLVREALVELDLAVVDLRPAVLQSRGVFAVVGSADDGSPVLVKVFGRDAWDAQLLRTAWRTAWYRASTPTLTLNRVQQVEHEAFATLLAAQAGVPVPVVLTAGITGRGDALLAVRPTGVPIAGGDAPVNDAVLASAWAGLERMHATGMSVGHIDGQTLLVDGSQVMFADLAEATVAAPPARRLADRAQLLAVTAGVVGTDRAVAAAVAPAALGTSGLAETVPYLQRAALSGGTTRLADGAELDVDALRAAAAAAAGVADPELVRLRRVTWGSVIRLGLIGFVAYILISQLADIGFDTIVETLSEATLSFVLLGLVIAQVPRLFQAVSVRGACDRPLPYGPVAVLQYAISFINIAIPSTAARVATNVRFFQRVGVPSSTAVAMGALDSVMGFVVQITILLTIFLTGWATLDLQLGDWEGPDASRIIAVVMIGLAVAVALVWVIRPLRRRVAPWLGEARRMLGALRDPRRLSRLVFGNLGAEVAFAMALGSVARAFGVELGLADLLAINVGVSMFAGLLPVPGGIGVAEAGLTAGFVAAGVSQDAAFAIALTYRMCSFYLPPIWGAMALKWLQRRNYL